MDPSDLSRVERVILDRFWEKCRIAGGVRAGYVLRRDAIHYIADDHPGLDFDEGLDSLEKRGLLKPNEERNFWFLAEPGAEVLTALHG